MGLPKGQTNNLNGRPKGQPNKLTKELRAVLKDVLFNEIESLPIHLQSLQIKDRLDLVVKLLPYAIPRIEAASYKIGEPNDWFEN
jgi:hypothetical protein